MVTAAVVTTAVATPGYSWIKHRYFLSINDGDVDADAVVQHQDEHIEEMIDEHSDDADSKVMSDVYNINTGADDIDVNSASLSKGDMKKIEKRTENSK